MTSKWFYVLTGILALANLPGIILYSSRGSIASFCFLIGLGLGVAISRWAKE